jgi:hypothetical protein
VRRETTVLGIPNARFFTDQPALIVAEQERALIREAEYLHASRGGPLPTGHFLSLSGGGGDGLSELVCWSAGPSFELALIMELHRRVQNTVHDLRNRQRFAFKLAPVIADSIRFHRNDPADGQWPAG